MTEENRIEIPKGGYRTLEQATEAISSILNPPKQEKIHNEPTKPDSETEAARIDDGNAQDTETGQPDKTEDTEDTEDGGVDTRRSDEDATEVEWEEGEIPETNEEVEYDYSALAQALGVDEDDLIAAEDGSIRFRTKVNGELGEIAVSDLRDSYQMKSAAQKGMHELAEEKKAFYQERKSALEGLGEQQTFMQQALQAMHQEYVNDYQNLDWDKLYQEDPDAYHRQTRLKQEREQKINNFNQQFQEARKQINQQIMEELKKIYTDGSKSLEEAFSSSDYKTAPKWNDDERGRLTRWMIDQGFPEQNLSQLAVWQVFKWARDSMLREQERGEAKKTMKKVVKLPRVKMTKPTTPKTKEENKKKRVNDAKRRQRNAAISNQYGKKSNFNESVDLISEIMKREA